MTAPYRFAQWLSTNRHSDKRWPHSYLYHPRSSKHSEALSRLVLQDLLNCSQVIRQQVNAGKLAFGIEVPYRWQTTAKSKTIDFVVGVPEGQVKSLVGLPIAGSFHDIRMSCELKSTFTEHAKSQPRIFDELSSSHTIVNTANPEVLALGIATVNIAARFASPLRQSSATLQYTEHKQPHVTEKMIKHLGGLPLRDSPSGSGFDAFCVIVVDTDNVSYAKLETGPPAPQVSEPLHYSAFLSRAVSAYESRFGLC